jgi:CRP-like cAMP-binding protein
MSGSENLLLSAMKPEDVARFQSVSRFTELRALDTIEKPYEDIQTVFFPIRGVLSIEAVTRTGFAMQVAMIGSEGASGTALVLTNRSSTHTTRAHTDAAGWSVETPDFLALMSASFRFRNAMLRYTGIIAGQMASAALANGRCTVPQRVARWILQMHGRMGGNLLAITHDAIAECLGTRRPGVTNAMHVLEGRHLIRSSRSQIEILDRIGLIEASNGSYREGD